MPRPVVHDCVDSFGPQRWQRFGGGDFHLSPEWLRTVQEDYRSAFIRLDDDSAAAAVFRIPPDAPTLHNSLRILLDPEVWQELSPWLDEDQLVSAGHLCERIGELRPPDRATATCLVPFAFTSALCAPAGSAGTIDALVAGMREVTASWNAAAAAVLYVPAFQADALHGHGFASSRPMPSCELSVGWSDFARYLAGLSGKRRKHVRKELEGLASAGATTEFLHGTQAPQHIVARMAELSAQLMRRYGYQTEAAEEFAVISLLMDRLGGHIRVTLVTAKAGIVAFGLFYERGDQLYASMSSQDYSVPGAHLAAAFYEPIRLASQRGTVAIHYGPSGYETKAGRGCRLRHSWGRFDYGPNCAPALRELARLHEAGRARPTESYGARRRVAS